MENIRHTHEDIYPIDRHTDTFTNAHSHTYTHTGTAHARVFNIFSVVRAAILISVIFKRVRKLGTLPIGTRGHPS